MSYHHRQHDTDTHVHVMFLSMHCTIVFLLMDSFVYIHCAYATLTYMATNQP